MEWGDLNPFSWGEKDLDQFKTDLSKDPRLEHGNLVRSELLNGLDSVRGRAAPQARGATVGQISRYGGGGQFRSQLAGLSDRLGAIASGQQMGAGELAARRAGAAAAAQQQGFARSQRGAGAALAARTAARNTADIGLGTAGQAQQAALQDQQAALAQQGQVLGMGSAQDVQVGLARMDAQNQRVFQQAGLDQATSLANMQARLSTMGMNDQASLAYLSQLYGIDQAEMAARLQQDQLRVQQGVGLAGVDTSGWGANLMNIGGQIGVAAASDRRAKTKIVRAKDVDAMLERLKPYEYEYKDPEKPLRGRGRHVSVMAQDLERSDLGKKMVSADREGTKVVDYGKGLGTMLAAVARVHERVAALEGKGK